MEDSHSPRTALQLEMRGYKYSKWTVKMRDSFVSGLRMVFDKLSHSTANPETGETVSDEASKLTAGSLRYAEARLAAPGVENQQKVAQIEKSFDEREKIRAETRKTEAETDQIAVDTEGKRIANEGNKIANAMAILKLNEELIAFRQRTGKKVNAQVLGELDEELIVLPRDLVPQLAQVVSNAALMETGSEPTLPEDFGS